MGRTIGRRVVDIAQKSRGRSALRYELEVIPYFCVSNKRATGIHGQLQDQPAAGPQALHTPKTLNPRLHHLSNAYTMASHGLPSCVPHFHLPPHTSAHGPPARGSLVQLSSTMLQRCIAPLHRIPCLNVEKGPAHVRPPSSSLPSPRATSPTAWSAAPSRGSAAPRCTSRRRSPSTPSHTLCSGSSTCAR